LELYDPDIAPVAAEWLALSELERIDLVEAFHEESGGFGQSIHLHAALHAVVENQLALGEPLEARRALSRLVAGGSTRHEAIHAIGGVLAEFLFPTLSAEADAPPFDTRGYLRALSELTIERWRSNG